MTFALDAKLGRREFAIVGALWATLSAAFIYIHWNGITGMNLPDADDYLRLQQVRDWLAGQSWFDVTQHRINPPTGGIMHWSRVVDLPLAAGILLLTPFFGQPTAEMITAVAVPLIVMLTAMLLVAAIASRLIGKTWAPVAAASIPFSAITYPQMLPLRVDHHGWQVVLALVMLFALMDETRKRRAALIAGVAAAFWLNISIESLPVITCVALLLGARWLFDARELPRLQSYLWALTLSSFALETATMPAAWTLAECDRVSQPYLFTFGAASLAAAAASWPRLGSDWRWRLGFAGIAGAGAGAVFAISGPACLGGPFAALDPLTTSMWLDRVGESMPLFKRGIGATIAIGGFALLGILGAAIAVRSTQGEMRMRWITVLTLAVASSALMLVMSRSGAVAHAYAAAGAAFLGLMLLQHARAMGSVPIRALGTVLGIAAMTPVLLLPALKLDLKPGAVRRVCTTAYQSLNTLAPGLVYAPLDIGPRMIAHTPHSVIATGHHRNHLAMHEVIATFTGSAEQARETILGREADYVVVCADAHELRNYARYAPDGFAAQLIERRLPHWLTPLNITPADSELLVFAVTPIAPDDDQLRGRFALETRAPTHS